MARATYALVFILLAASTFAAAPVAETPTVIVHFDQLKDGKLEGDVKDIGFRSFIGVSGDTPYIRLTNQTYAPRSITLRILGLVEPQYDLYVDTNPDGTKKAYSRPPTDPRKPDLPDYSKYIVGARSKEQLESGIPIFFAGTSVPSGYHDYFSNLRARAQAGAKRYEMGQDDDAGFCRAIFTGIIRWVDSLENSDERVRSVNLFLVPAGKSFKLAYAGPLPPPEGFQSSSVDTAESVQALRHDVAKKVKNASFRFDTLEIMTPIDFRLVPAGPLAPGKKVIVRAVLTNWTDRMVTGKIALGVPKGWKVRAISKAVKMRGYSKSAEAKFEITVPKTAKAGATISADADLMVQDVRIKLTARTK